ncbi:MAG: hypothetical protein GC134_09185 [Proteobacteria bacterium]|nr:hypothetical protein [Pseudomonadota bacterium]
MIQAVEEVLGYSKRNVSKSLYSLLSLWIGATKGLYAVTPSYERLHDWLPKFVPDNAAYVHYLHNASYGFAGALCIWVLWFWRTDLKTSRSYDFLLRLSGGGANPELMREQLQKLSKRLNMNSNYRVSVYVLDQKNKIYKKIGRYSGNKLYDSSEGRGVYPLKNDGKACGLIHETMNSDKAFIEVYGLPDPDEDFHLYYSDMKKKMRTPTKSTVREFEMKSRAYLSFCLYDSSGTQKTATVVIEKTCPESFPADFQEKITVFLKGDQGGNLMRLVEVMAEA